MTQPTDDLAAQMVREMLDYLDCRAPLAQPDMEVVARRYMEKAIATEREHFSRFKLNVERKISAERAGKDGR